MKCSGVALLVLGIVAGRIAHAQPEPPLRAGRLMPIDFVGAAVFPGEGPASQRIDCAVRIPRLALVAVKGSEPGDPPFVRRGELTVECVDSVGTVEGRRIEQIVIPSDDAVDEPLPLTWIERALSIDVPRGNYTVNVELVDLQSRNRVVRNTKVRALPSAPNQAELSFFFLSGEAGTLPDTLRPQNFGNGILFSAPGGGVLLLSGIPDSVRSADVRYRFVEDSGRVPRSAPVFEGSVAGLPLRTSLSLLPGSEPRYVTGKETGSVRYLAIPLPLERLPLRRLKLHGTVTAGGRELTFSAPLMCVWPDQPESLRDDDLALEVLRYVVSERELDSLSSGNFEERLAHLENFWKRKDPTPETADNPIMTEFYRRVDHARTGFATLKVKDGLKTDRGKIYLLQGPPTSVERKLDPSRGFTETWYYAKSRKQFLFRDESRDGSYVLVRQ